MAVANFIHRAATAASRVLQNFDPHTFEDVLQSRLVGIAFDSTAIGSAEGHVALGLATDLLARLYPRIAILPTDKNGHRMADRLTTLANAINPEIDIMSDARELDACLCMGRTSVAKAMAPIYIGSSGWVARLSSTGPVGCGATQNPFGAAAAACFGVANVFRAIFRQQLLPGGLDRELSLSLLDLAPGTKRPKNPALGPVDIGESHLIGVGAIGNAAVWALARVPGLRGTLHLVDDEDVDLGNLQRYVLTVQGSQGRSKVDLATEAFRGADLRVRPHRQTWDKYLQERCDWNLQRVAVALDSAQDRVAVQAALPRWIVNAWTQTGDLGISRHGFITDDACLACLYLPDKTTPDLSQLVADAIGLPGEKREVGRYLHTNAPLEREFIVKIADAKQTPPEKLLPFVGKTLRSFYSEAVCGAAVFQFSDRNGQANRTEVPMGFQSAMAGILLASELAVHAAGLRRVPPSTTTTIDLLRPLGKHISLPRKKDRAGRCICQDNDYIAAYNAKYLGCNLDNANN